MNTAANSLCINQTASNFQTCRTNWKPLLPSIFEQPYCTETVHDCHYVNGEIDTTSAEGKLLENSADKKKSTVEAHVEPSKFQTLFPLTYGKEFVRFTPCPANPVYAANPINIGVVLSGGQAPGGHNVIIGVFDYIKKLNPNSQLYGFLGGPHGVYSHEYVELTANVVNEFRNQGGFHLIRSGRHKIETVEQKEASLAICQALALQGLIIIGGDDSNTNAAILAEYFQARCCETRVIGCPKTIDGDLRNEYIEASFGFDTAVKTYSEFIGNLCLDVATSGKYYHFVRLMGRSASHITLECAFQTRPNLAYIGEEVLEKKLTLLDLVDEIVEMVITRNKMGKDFGIILLPEGLIEFFPQIGGLIEEINGILAAGEFDVRKLTADKAALFKILPVSIQNQLLLERDPHGNVQVAMIATERLLILMVELELSRKKYTGPFNPQPHYFGYEGRCGLPSNFDCNYCYALGFTSGALISNGHSGYMARLSSLHLPSSEWVPGGCPFTKMMVIERRKGKDVPVIKKYLVELDSPLFKLFEEVRAEWKYNDLYKSPGSIQFEGPLADVSNYTIGYHGKEDALPVRLPKHKELQRRHHFVRLPNELSDLERYRLDCPIEINPLLLHTRAVAVAGKRVPCHDAETKKMVLSNFPMQCRLNGMAMHDVRVGEIEFGNLKSKSRIGVALTGQQAPGVANIIWGLFDKLKHTDGILIGFKAGGLFTGEHITITEEDAYLCHNQGGFTVLGRQGDTESLIATPNGIDKIRETCHHLNLDGLVIIGGRWALTDACMLTENFLQNSMKTKIVAVPATQNNNIDSQFLESTIGFDTASKCYSQLVGNLLTDAASATKYWYFVRLMGRDKSHMVLEAALQSHPNITLVSEAYSAGDKTLEDVVADIADIVCARAEMKKNYGTVVIPEGLFSELPQIRHLLQDLNKLWGRHDIEDKKFVANELIALNSSDINYTKWLSPWSLAVLNSFPEFIRKQIIQPRHIGRFQLSRISTEELLSQMVASELSRRKAIGEYEGTFSPVCLYLGYQARSSLPSEFDCAMGRSHGCLAAISILSGLTGYCTSLRGLCGPASEWIPMLFPLHGILRIPSEELYASKVPMVSSHMVNLGGNALGKIQEAASMWARNDKFCNPGPIQFFGKFKDVHTKYLYEEHHAYLKMLSEVSQHLQNLSKSCSFGVDASTLRTTCLTLRMLSEILSHSEEGVGKTANRKLEDKTHTQHPFVSSM